MVSLLFLRKNEHGNNRCYYRDYYCGIQGYKTRDGHIHITKEYCRGVYNIT